MVRYNIVGGKKKGLKRKATTTPKRQRKKRFSPDSDSSFELDSDYESYDSDQERTSSFSATNILATLALPSSSGGTSRRRGVDCGPSKKYVKQQRAVVERMMKEEEEEKEEQNARSKRERSRARTMEISSFSFNPSFFSDSDDSDVEGVNKWVFI